MTRQLRAWESSGRESDAEYAEMAADITRTWQSLTVGRVIQRPKAAVVKDRSSWSSASSSSTSNTSAQRSRGDKPANLDHRRESEKFVNEALDRGEPVTLFSSETRSKAAPYVAGRRDFGQDRDVTPTPADPYSLRQDPVSPHTPRKRAALYDSPRWPTGGRPSPDTPSHTPRKSQTQDLRRRGMDVERPLDDLGGDPAERIWKGIDEEYTSPGGGGGIMRKRWGRRKGSFRPSGAESMMSAPSLYQSP